MLTNNLKATWKTALRVAGVLPFAAVVALGQQQINLTAGPASITLPDGSVTPMWGYSCGAAVAGSLATCAKLNPLAPAATTTTPAGWSPVVITVPTGQTLQINLTNNLSFGATPNKVPTSLVIVGQLGGGLGTSRTTTLPPDHSSAQQTTWPIANPGATGTPPVQGPRVQSFSTEVAAGTTAPLTWTTPRPGTYLIESGTHPSIQGPMGLYGMLVVTAAPAGATAGTAYPGVSYNADVPLLLSEIDPVQNNSVNAAVSTVGFSETKVWSGRPGGCGNPSSGVGVYNTCYPPAVNYSPLYYLFNGVAFNKTNASASLFPATPATGLTPATGKVLVRFVNAGLRMHVPSIVGAQTTGQTATGAAATVGGVSLVAEDGNPLPGVTRVQSEVFLAAGKTYDVMVNVPAAGPALPVFDRQLSLSGNATSRDAGMLAYIGINGAALPSSAAFASAVANPDVYNSLVPCAATPCPAFVVSDPAKGVVANDVNVYGVKVLAAPTQGVLTLNANGSFTYIPNATGVHPDSFTYQANGNPAIFATVTLGAATLEAGSGIVVNNITYTSNVATALSIKSPGVLSVDKDGAGYPLNVATSTVVAGTGSGTGLSPCGSPVAAPCVSVDKSGSFNAFVSAAGTYHFTYKAQNSQGTLSASAATVTLIFPTATNLSVSVVDGKTKTALTGQDYRWIIEEDKTFYIDPAKTVNTGPTGAVVPMLGTNFHTSFMPVVAQGCTGPLSCESGQTVLGAAAVCDVGNGACRTTAAQQTPVLPSQVHLDPTKRYYISVLPGDAANPFIYGNSSAGHGMGGAPIAAAQTAVTVLVETTPFPPSKLSVFVFEDDFPLNGENDAGGGALGNLADGLAANEPGLGNFEITLFDDAGGTGDPTGQMTYDMFNMPLSNALAGTIDPVTGKDACPISAQVTAVTAQKGLTGRIVTCPTFEADNTTYSPLAGQAVVANLMPGRYGVVATPAADRVARGEEWLQTNTLDGQKAHDSFLRVGEPSYFQEYGPAGYHVSIAFANPKIINARLPEVCAGITCNNSVSGTVTTERMSRTPDERLYGSGSRDSFAFTQCYVSLGDPDGEDFAFTKCDSNGNFALSGLPDGDWRITIFDQWNDQLVDGLSVPVALAGGKAVNMGEIPVNQWQANIYTRTFFDKNGDGVSQDAEPGLSLVPTNIRFRDGSFSNFNNTDLDGYAGFNEVFPLFNWYTVETDTTRYKSTGTHVVYDAGGPADGTTCGGGYPPCSATAVISKNMANSIEQVSVPTNLRVPGSVYCNNADCTGYSIQTPGNTAPPTSGTNYLSTGRIDPPWVSTYGWQGFSGQNSFIEFGKMPYAVGENGGIGGHVVYASTRPFDDPQLLLQTSWEPLVPHVTINLYQEGVAADNITPTLTLVDTTQTSSWDDWAQGFRSDGIPNMNCPGQTTADLFYYTLFNQPMYLNQGAALPNNSQFKCYDGMHNWNQVQPAPYDGKYQFPSIVGRNPQSGVPTGVGTAVRSTGGSVAGTNCTICTTDTTDAVHPTPMLPAGKYVVEVVVPPGYELVKEEDKNILIGDNYIAPAVQQFGALASIFILPDQAAVASAYNANNAQNPTSNLGSTSFPRHEGDTGEIESYWPCVGAARIVPDYISLFPQSREVAPFAGSTRNLCDRKEVTLEDQSSQLAKFYIFTSTHAASHFTGIITDDFTSEFDPFSPQFGEKFAPANLPVSIRDWTGAEVSRVYSDWWGTYDGLNYSTWEVNPPNPTGYAPTMMVTCMNDPGPILDTRVGSPTLGKMIVDPLFNSSYSQFCYELPFMPGQTGYFDTPVVPTSSFSDGYNHPDCAYPATTPAISSVNGDGVGPWVSAAGKTLTITALGDQLVNNYAYSGPSATVAPFNAKMVTRHYGFGATRGTVAIQGTNSAGAAVSVPATITGWSDTSITVTVPTGVPNCLVQQQAQYGGSAAQCGELVITTAAGQQSIDTVTVTIGGKAPTRIAAGQTIQSAIDAASPGDLVIVPPGTYNEMLLMWKPLRLQGVGAASSVINANAQPAGKLDPWRRQVNCLFGLALNGQPSTSNTNAGSTANPFDSTGTYSCGTGWNYFSGLPNNPQVDRLPLEAVLGWDATLNGNLAEQLQEPTLMGAYEGSGITVLGRGVDFHGGLPFASDIFPTGTTLLTSGNCSANPNPFPSNFQCNPSRIDGLSVTDSSQGGGGIFVHAWAHNLEIANNRVYNNHGTLAGGINVGQGEFPPQYIKGSATNPDPGSCLTGSALNALPNLTELPYCFDLNVNLHHNQVTLNTSIGDELFSATPSGIGGVAICNGADYYKFNYNWVCGNMSVGDGGGVGHIGFIYNGDIEHNSILFNQSLNPTIPTNGGGLIVMGSPDPDPVCGTQADQDCPVGLSDGTGPGLVINANLIQGNAAESGSGGGLRFQNINGTEVTNFPTQPANWYSVSVTNNIISNNVAGWDGAGVSLQDALSVNFINNTIVSNDTTASSGVLFNTLGAPLASAPPPGTTTSTSTTSAPQPSGLVAVPNSPPLLAAFATIPAATGVTCPTGHFLGGSAHNGTCLKVSDPILANDVFWQNRSFYIGVGALSAQYQQNIVTLHNSFSGTAAVSQPSAPATQANGGGSIITGGSGACTPGASYWDIGVRGDTGPGNHGSGFTLAPTYSVLTDAAADYSSSALHNLGLNPTVASQYCNGSRIPPECTTADGCFGAAGFNVPPGISDATVPNPIFSLLPSATVDEGNNWVNMTWGPLSIANPVSGGVLGNYALAAGSPAIDYVPVAEGLPTGVTAPTTDFFGNSRPDAAGTKIDIGAVEFRGASTPIGPSVSPASLAFGNASVGTVSAPQTLTLSNPGTGTLAFTLAFTGTFSRPAAAAGGTCASPLAAASTCTINVVFSPTAATAATGTLAITATPAVTGSPVSLTGTGVAPAGAVSVTPAALTFGNVTISDTSAAQTLTLVNTTAAAVTGIGVSASTGFSRPTGTAGGTCTATLNAPTAPATSVSCTINVVFTPTALGNATGTLTLTSTVAGLTIAGSPVALSGVGVIPALITPLDTFNRAAAPQLNATGFPWLQLGATTTAALQVFDTGPADPTTGVAYCNNTGTPVACPVGGTAYWNLPTTGFGAKQAASFQFVNATITGPATIPGYSLMLKGTSLTGAQSEANHVRVTYIPGTGVRVAYSTTAGLAYTVPAGGTLAAAFNAGDTMGALVDSAAKVWVWQTSGATTTLVGTVQLPNAAPWNAGGVIGIQLPPGGQVDNFAGGIVP